MKVRFIHFDIAKYGGIVEEIENRVWAFKQLGWDADIIRITYNQDEKVNAYKRKIDQMESGEWDKKLAFHSQNKGYEKSKITGYWKNSYYGWVLPPWTNLIPCKHENGLSAFYKALEGVDLVFWSFMPTKNGDAEGLSDWWKYFDLPKSTRQVFIVHDGYFDKRSSWISALKDKISYLECVHLASYNCCSNISIPRKLALSPRVFPNEMFEKLKDDRTIDFFSAHIFKSMKRMDELIRAIPYLEKKYITLVAGNDIEYNYMTSVDKVKPNYLARKKEDPDLVDGIEEKGLKIWDRAIEADMIYAGLLPNSEVLSFQQNSKFFIDPSWCTHYAEYNRTNINSSIIEAAINGCYPVIRDYAGLEKHKKYITDNIFEQLKAIVIPWDATPKQFASYLKEAMNMSEEQYYNDTWSNFNLFKSYSDALLHADATVKLLKSDLRHFDIGKDSELVLKQTSDVMENFFNIKLPIVWENQ